MKLLTSIRSMIKHSVISLLITGSCYHVIAQPVVSALSSYMGIAGTTMTVTGTGFNATPANNIVYFGSVKAAVTAATTTSLTVTVPFGTTYKPVSVLNTATSLSGSTKFPFFNTYNNSAYFPGTVNFATPVVIATDKFPNHMTYGDIDGDGKVDIISNNYSSGTVTVFRNTSTIGSVSYDAPDTIVMAGSAGIPAVGDIDGDGKLDVVVPAGMLYICRNTSTPGSISFAAAVPFSGGGATAAVADIDGDGKADVIGGGGTVCILRNTGSPGTLSFASAVCFTALSSSGHLSTGDIDGDGKTDIVCCYESSGNVSVFRNTSTVGSVALATRQDYAAPSKTNCGGLADIDGDGKLDLITSNTSASNFSYFPSSSTIGTISLGTRVDVASGGTPADFSIGDIDGDGKPDVALASLSAGRIYVYRNTSSVGSFSFASGVQFAVGASQPAGLLAADIDGDGKADLVCTNQGANSFSTLINNPLHTIAGTAQVCYGATITLSNATVGGKWSSSNTAMATIGSSSGMVAGTGVAGGTATITYAGTAGSAYVGNIATITITVNPLPTAILGTTVVCKSATTTLSDASTGGTWSSNNTSIAIAGTASGIITGVAAGTTTVTYTLSTGCLTTTPVTVNPLPSTISGIPKACIGATTTLSDATTGGEWSSGNTSVATAGSSSGIVIAVTAGTATITYVIGTGCYVTVPVTINPLPVIAGAANVCEGVAAVLSSPTGSGTWSSGNTAIATIDPLAGVVAGIAAGTATITYVLSTGCTATTEVSVVPLPVAGTISGPSSVCLDSVIVLSGTIAGGAWTNTYPTATVTATGAVTGISIGVDTIIYSVSNICGTATTTWPLAIVQCDFTQVTSTSAKPGVFSIHPNPNNGIFIVSGSIAVADDQSIILTVTDVLGRVVYNNTEVAVNGVINVQVVLDDIAGAGMYMLNVRAGASNYASRIIIGR